MALTVGEIVGYLTLKDSAFHRAIDQAEGGLNRLGGAIGALGKGAGLAVLAGQAVQLVAALAPAAGAVLALPAAMAAAKVATATFKVGVQGVSEAMAAAGGDAKAMAAAMKELSPAAQSFVLASAGIKKSFEPIQQAVQQKLFQGLTGPLKEAAANVLPTVKTGMVGVAGALNGMGKEALKVTATPFFKGQLAQVFENTTKVVGTLKGGISPLITIVMKLATLGAPLAQRMAEWAVNGAKAAAAFLKSKEGGDKLAGIAQRAGDTLATLGGIVKNLAVFLQGLFKPAATDGQSLLDTIEQVTARMAAWAQSAAGQEKIGNVFTLLNQTLSALGPVLGLLVGPLGAVASIISSLPPGVQESVAKFLAFSIVVAAIGGKIGVAVSAIRVLAVGIGSIPAAASKVATAATAIGSFAVRVAAAAVSTAAAAGRMVVSMATAAAGFVVNAAKMTASMVATAARVVAGWVLMGAQSLLQAARVAAAWVLAMGPIGWVIAAVVALVALIVANWDTIKEAIGAAWEWIQEKTSAVWDAITGALTAAWENVKAGAAATWEWIKDAVATAAEFIVGIFQNFTLPGLIMKHWDSIKAGAQAAWDWVVDKVKAAANNVIAGVEVLSSLPGKVHAWWNDLVQGAINKALELVAWAKGFGAQILAGLGKLGSLLLSAGKDLVLGLINGVLSMVTRVIDAIKGVVGGAIQAAKNLLGIASPSKVFTDIGSWTMKGLIQGLTSEEANVKSTVEKMVDTVKTAFKSQPDVVEGLIDFIKLGNKNLEDLALQREGLVQRLADAKEMAKKVAGSAQEWADITGLNAEDITGASDMAAELQGKASAINNFANNINELARRGLNKKIIQDLIDAGVEKGASFAEMMVGSDGSEIKALNKAQAAVDAASKKLGKASADAMYDAGKKSGDGYLTGLQDSLKKLDAEMTKIVKALVTAIKKELKIKSPSQVMADIGVNTMLGYIEGIQSMEASTLGAMTGLVGNAVSATADAAVGGVGQAASSTMAKQAYAGYSVGDNIRAYEGGGGFAGSAPASGQAGVTINMPGAVFHEKADVQEFGARVGFEYSLRGNV